MSKILGSASKMVFLMIALTACVGFVVGKLPVDQFMILATGSFSFYFTHKGEPKTPEDSFGGK